MKNLIKKFFFIIIMCILYGSILVSCAKNQFKTIIIDDNTINKSSIDGDEDKDSFKIYQYNLINSNEVEGGIEYLLGWYDNDNVITANNFNRGNIVLNKINYKYYFKNKVMDINYLENVAVDNDNLAYSVKDQLIKVYVRALKNDKNKLISEINTESYKLSQLRWSKNGRYLTFSVYLQDSHEVYIYDISKNELKKIPLFGLKYSAFPEIIISDNSEKVIVMAYEDKNQYGQNKFSMYLFGMEEKSFDANKITPMKSLTMPYVEFVNSNKIIYIDKEIGSLNIYDINSNKSLVVDDNVKYFKISSDSRNIAYLRYLSKEGPNIYNCKINDDKIEGKQLLYKGFLPIEMKWSSDSKKILVKGGIYSDFSIEYEQIIRDIKDKPRNYRNLIFEFQ